MSGKSEPLLAATSSPGLSASTCCDGGDVRHGETVRSGLEKCVIFAVLAAVVLAATFPSIFFKDANHSNSALRRTPSPWLEINGGRPYTPGRFDWDGSTCTSVGPARPQCNSANKWKAMVSMTLEGEVYENVSIKTRGHLSLTFSKSQFALKFPQPVSLLGLPPARKWVLAMSFVDSTFQRNAFAFDLYRGLGGWASHTSFVNLRLQGLDLGLYYISEPIEVGPGRLDFSGAAQNDVLLRVDWPKPGQTSATSPATNTAFNFASPKNPDTETLHMVQELVNRLDGADAENITDLVDWTSVARFYILEELARDVDGYAFSSWWRVHDGRLYHAAPWDFDLAWGFDCDNYYFRQPGDEPRPGMNVTSTPSTAGWMADLVRDGAAWPGADGSPGGGFQDFHQNKRAFFTNLWKHPQLRRAFANMWTMQRGPGGILTAESLVAMIDNRRDNIRSDAERDLNSIWRKAQRCGMFTSCCYANDAKNFGRATMHLKDYVLTRARWIDENVAL